MDHVSAFFVAVFTIGFALVITADVLSVALYLERTGDGRPRTA